MFYPNLKPRHSVKKAKIDFTNFENSMNVEIDEALMPYKTAKMSYNFNVKNGALTNGYGASALTLPKVDGLEERVVRPPDNTSILKLWHFRCYDQTQNKPNNELVMFCDDGYIYSTRIFQNAPFCSSILQEQINSGIDNAVNYRLNSNDVMLFSSQTDGLWKYQQNYYLSKVEEAPVVKSMCLHYERLFAIVAGERNRLAFSANLDITDWSQDLSSGGFIEMQDERGALNQVVSFNDYVYVFRDFGVSRVSAYGDQSDFSVSHLFKSSVKLYGNTVTVCGNKILLLAKDGIHVFDGYSTKKLNLGIDKLFENVDNDNACGIYYNNKFLLACRLNFNDDRQIGCESFAQGYTNNALIELDLSTNEISISRGMDIACMCVIDEESFTKVALCFNGEHKSKLGMLSKDGQVFGVPLTKSWVSPKSNMGYPTKIKHITECLINTKNDCCIHVKTEKESKQFEVPGNNVSQRVKINMQGEQLEVGFESVAPGECYISCPQISIEIND